jgi:hypothetical protein
MRALMSPTTEGEMVTKKSMADWLSRLQTDETVETHEGATSPEQSLGNGTPLSHGGATSAESPTSVTFATSLGEWPDVFSEPPCPTPEVITVAYQKIPFDWAIADGTYTPQRLRNAKLVVKPGPELRYPLRWPGGTPQPITNGAYGRGVAC